MRSRLAALQGVVDWLFEQNAVATNAGSPLLRLAKKPFRFQATFNPLNAADLDVLLACELLESRAGLLDALIGLAQPSSRRRDSGRSFTGLTFLKEWRFGGSHILLFAVPEASRDSELGPGDFDLILHDDSPDLRLNPGLWSQIECRIRPKSAGYEERRDQLQVQVSDAVFRSPIFQDLMRTTSPGGWCVDGAFKDINAPRAVAFLANLAQGTAP